MAGSLEGPVAKLIRAELHGRSLQRQIEAEWPSEPWPVRREEHRGGLEHRFYVGELPKIKPEWTLILGEILFDLRSALDHLVFQLHVRKFDGTVPPCIEAKIQFPIYDSVKGFQEKGTSRIRRLDKAERDAIRALQPYHRRDEGRHHRVNLGLLNTLHNIDKHRKLHLVSSLHSAIRQYEFPPETGFAQTPVWGVKKSHDQVDTWTFTSPPSQMQEHEGAHIDVCIEVTGDADKLIPVLFELHEAVAYALRQFTDRFPPISVDGRKRSMYGTAFWRP